MHFTTVRAKVHRDRTGTVQEIPVILTEAGPLSPLVDYLLEYSHARSFAWMQKTIQAVGLLLDYLVANHDCFANPKELFSAFVHCLYTGTIGDDGVDPSGLYWLPKSISHAKQLANQLSNLSSWMAEKSDLQPLNPLRSTTRYEEMLHWAAWHQKHDRAFLAHSWNSKKTSSVAKRAKNTLLRRSPSIDHAGVKYFTDERIFDLLFHGFIVPGKQKSPRLTERINLRDVLITMLMHFGGLRVSEPFHLYVHDVMSDPFHPDKAMVRVYHPSDGRSPNDWLDVHGQSIKCNREAYLRGKYGMRPRNQYFSTGQLHAGWKNNQLDSKDGFMHVHWFPTWSGQLFLTLWNLFLVDRALKQCDHPFAFVTESGNPYAVDSFMRAHKRAIERIGLVPAKMLGTTPHGHRHAYGQRLTDANIDPIYRKKALHHKSLESQLVYTEPQCDKVSQILNAATSALESGITLHPPNFMEYGFEDVDPLGLLSGPSPKLKRRS